VKQQFKGFSPSNRHGKPLKHGARHPFATLPWNGKAFVGARNRFPSRLLGSGFMQEPATTT